MTAGDSGPGTAILIGGPPGAGKSTLGRALAAELGYGSLSGDDLAVAARAVTTPADQPALHQMATGHVAYFTDTPASQLITDAVSKERAVWPAVERVVQSHLRSRTGVVLDWWLLRPSTVATMGPVGPATLWLHVDPDVLWSRERANTDFLQDFDDPERVLEGFMERSLWRNDLIRREAEEHDLPVLHVVDQTVDDLVAEALAALGASGRPGRAWP